GVDLGIGDRIERAACGTEQRLRMREALVLGIELVPFAVGRRQLGHFADLPREALAFALQLALVAARRFERLERGLPLRPQAAQLRGIDAGALVEQLAHRGRPREALPGVLAVDVHAALGRLAPLR